MRYLAILAFVFSFSLPAFADTGSIDFSNPVVTPDGGSNFLWHYVLTIDQAEDINTAINSSFATLYDINGLVSGTGAFTVSAVQPTLTATVSQQNTGITPSLENPVDSASLPNLTVHFTGNASPLTVLGTLTFDDVFGQTGATSDFAAQATLVADNSVSQNISSIASPAPEPSTIVTSLPILFGMGMYVIKKRRRK